MKVSEASLRSARWPTGVKNTLRSCWKPTFNNRNTP